MAEGEVEFDSFVSTVEPRLRRALVARYGTERGREATAEALGYAFEHWERVRTLGNPVGYLYRVGQSRSRSRRVRVVFERPPEDDPWVEPALPSSLAALPEKQRVAVSLVCGADWSYAEVAELLGVSKSSVQSRVERGLARLRHSLGVEPDA